MSYIINPYRFAAATPEGTGVIWDVTKWRCDKGIPVWDLDGKRFLGSNQPDPPTSQVNSTISNGYGEGTHYAEFLVSNNDSLTGAGAVSPSWWTGTYPTGTCSSESAGATPTSALQSYMTDQAYGTWKTDGCVNVPGLGGGGECVSVASTSVSNRIGIEVDVVGTPENGSAVRFYEVTSGGTRTLLTEVDYMNDGVDFSGDGKASFAATSYNYTNSIQIYSESADWWGTPTSGYVAMTSD